MIFQILKQHIYLYLLILVTIEGPITSFISAGFAAQGILRIEYVAIIAFLGDFIGDIFIYTIGRFFGNTKFIKKIAQNKSFFAKRLEKSLFLYMLIAKFTPYLSTPSLIFAGIKKVNSKLFILYSFLISVFVKIIYLTMGYLGSISVKQLQSVLSLRKQIALYIIIGTILFFVTKEIYKYIGKRIEKRIEEKETKID